jgi:hypothetical protein
MGKQYTHEEARAILAEAGIKYTRKEYMAGEVSHNDYEAQFVNAEVINYVLRGIGRDRILASKDEHFNDIPLAKWDALCGVSFFGSQMNGSPSFPNAFLVGLANLTTYAEGKSYGAHVSCGDGVCLLKAAARAIKAQAVETATV